MIRVLALAALAALAGPAAAAPPPPPDAPLVLANATLIDGTGAPPRPGTTIVIHGERIAAVGRDLAFPAGARVTDLGGAVVIPGLIDGHVHLTPWKDRDSQLEAMLRSGITTVREMGGDIRISGDVARRARAGTLAAPDVYTSAVFFGPLFLQDRRIAVAGSGFPPGKAPWMRIVTDDSDVGSAVAAARAHGVTGIKLYSQISPPLLARIVAEAHRQGLKVWSHATIFPSKPGDAVDSGVDTITHNGMLFAETQDDLPLDYHTGTRQWMARQDFDSVAPDSPAMARLFAAMVRNGTIYEPTLAGSERFEASNAAGTVLENIDWQKMRAWGCAATGAAYRAGVTISAGTDTAAGAPVQRELELLVGCGLPPMAALVAATRNAAMSIGIAATHGTIEPGKAADLVVLDRDPLADIANVRSVRMVVKRGRPVAR